MKRTLIASAAVLVLSALPTVSEAQWIGLSATEGASVCDISAPTGQVSIFYIIAYAPGGLTGAEFLIDDTAFPPGTWIVLSTTPAAGGIMLGSPFDDTTGTVIGFPSCVTDPSDFVTLFTVQVLNIGPETDLQMTVVPHPLNGGISQVDCVPNPPFPVGGGYAIFNPTLTACGWVPVELMSLSVE